MTTYTDHFGGKRRTAHAAVVACAAALTLMLTGCDEGHRLTSESVRLDDGRTVVCVREVGYNTRLDCDWSTAR